MKALLCSAVIAVVTLMAGCGGGSSSSSGSGSCTPGQNASVSIGASGFSPRAVCVVPGGTVTLTNADTVSHTLASTGSACSALNGAIAPGQSRAADFSTSTTCTFVDSAHSTDAAFQGTVAVSSAPTTGPGY